MSSSNVSGKISPEDLILNRAYRVSLRNGRRVAVRFKEMTLIGRRLHLTFYSPIMGREHWALSFIEKVVEV